MSGVQNTTGSPNGLTNSSTLVSFTEGVDDIVPSSPYSPDVIIILSVIVGVIIFITVFGNLLVVAAFFTTPKLRTYNNYFILGLAIADLLVGAVDMPLLAIVIIMGQWPFGEVFCDIFTFLDHAFTHTSVLLVALISLDRCVAVSAPFWHRQHWRRRPRAILIIAIGYIIPVIIWLPVTTLWQIIHGNEQRPFPKDVCEPLYFQSVVAGFVLPVAYFFIPFVLTAVLCARIYIVIRKFYEGRKKLRLALGIMQPTTSVELPNDLGTRAPTTSVSVSTKTGDVGKEENAKDNKKKEIGTESMKGVRILTFIVTAMWIAWFPSVIVAVTSPFCQTCVPSIIYSENILLFDIDSLINPICYALADEAFKDGFTRILTFRCLQGNRNLPTLRAGDF
ncbi:muscarinic acetylcholine receptor M3-like [Strongylocentrotus purpuratus]|uniref:G-protein coupled receptors family 1 profile domain-containing protein n=1 Tax=Strongylocentrotus purpuratus TaxID=7668 RepID=A0A7M7N7L4_STRPU|nr:muscarinic acetylcholine receptor M3-like [Strongylocentrotus purpuratus]